MTPVSLHIEEELIGGKRKGIGSILDLRTESRGSLRRTFSADMSSKKWLAQNTTMSSIDTSSSSSSSEDEEENEKNKDIWSFIQLQKTTNMNSLFNAPYIHPIAKRSSNSLSQKSLQICTESLGSETGSDGFSQDQDYFQSSSEEDDDEEEKEEEVEVVSNEMRDRKKELVAVNYNCCISKRSPTCSFPPPLSSISRRDGLRLRMRPHRSDGRLVVEAITVSSHYYLHAHRQGGRLQLYLINSPSTEEPHMPSQEEESEKEFKQEEEVVEEEERRIVLEVKAKQEEVMRRGHPTLVVKNKLICGMHTMRLRNPNPSMGKKRDGQDEQREREMSPSKTFNGYDRWWMRGPMAHPSAKPPPNMVIVPKKKPNVIKGEDLLPVMRRCNESLPLMPANIVWESYCIATT